MITRRPAVGLAVVLWGCAQGAAMGEAAGKVVALPEPHRDGTLSVEQTLSERRSHREYTKAPLTLAEAGQLLWAAQGLTGGGDHRTAPSAGALYPLEVYLLAGAVDGLPVGTYKYRRGPHALARVADHDQRRALGRAALEQEWVEEAPGVIVFSGVFRRTQRKYGERGVQYVHMEAGHAGQNVLLQATALGLVAVPVGAFEDDDVKALLNMPAEETPLYILPVGRPR